VTTIIRRLFRLIDWMMKLPDELEQQVCLEIERFEEARKMPYITSIERLGIKKGEMIGKKRGEERGEERGKRDGLLQGIEIALRIKFGQRGNRLLDELRALDDSVVLSRILEHIPDAKTLDEVRRMASQIPLAKDEQNRT
jgi:hypothetical protein